MQCTPHISFDTLQTIIDDSPDDGDDDDDDDDDCPSLEEAIDDCGGLGCIRRPYSNEKCIQCVLGCQSKLINGK